MSSQNIDQLLVERVQKGDKRAFNLLVQKYQHKVINIIMRYVKSQTEAQDVAQETFIKAYRGMANFRSDSSFYTWLYRIAVNASKDHITAQIRRRAGLEVDADDAEFFAGNEIMHDNHSPESLISTEEIKHKLFDYIDTLPEELREVLRMREFEEMSYEEIAEIMGCPLGTVRSRLFRARQAVDAMLKPLLQK